MSYWSLIQPVRKEDILSCLRQGVFSSVSEIAEALGIKDLTKERALLAVLVELRESGEVHSIRGGQKLFSLPPQGFRRIR